MDKLQKSETFLTHYEIEEGKITEYYGNNSKVSNIPNIPHNIEVCERRLCKQHKKAKESAKQDLNKIKQIKAPKMGILGAMGLMSIAMGSYTGVLVAIYCLAGNLLDIQLVKRKSWRLRITDYCLEHANFLKFSKTEKDASSTLSEKGKEAFEKDHGFSLNHAHLYTNNDLKMLKKVIGQ